ncbi:hypothetical protein GTO27_12915 [Candidatus Bathyarchaeota archaeon]|nr:hypothetical protein [Candidatus Bathyarchaeota archaeon]
MPSVHKGGHIIPSIIARDHILKAIREIDELGVPDRRKSTNYCLIHEQRHYPPKYVISIAARYAIGTELGHHDFYGGKGSGCANQFLRNRGFQIAECQCGGLISIEMPEAASELEGFREELSRGSCCCSDLLVGFTFEDIVEAEPPSEKGVYVVRIRKRSERLPEAMISEAKQLMARVGWKMLEKKVMSRIKRLRGISQCPVIYIGGAGTQPGSRNTLKGRYSEFSGRHTAMYPVWILLYFGWELEFGWKATNDPANEEAELKRKYRKIHQERLPALVEQ